MPIYTLSAADRAILAFAAKDYAEALGFAVNEFIRSELADLKTPEGGPLWDGREPLTVRPATVAEQATWEDDMPHAIRDQVVESREEALRDNHFVFLIDYREAYE